MLVSLNLIKKYVDLPASATAEDVVTRLSACTVEVEDVFEAGKDLENVVVGKVIKLEKHPNADKLRIALVDIGQEIKKSTRLPARQGNQEINESGESGIAKIVCGGINLYEGMLVAVAKPGAMVKWHGEGEPVKLEKTKIRGEESEGMICASDEIGLADRFPGGEGEIVDLTALDFQVGEPLAKELGLNDVLIDIDNKSITNRPDLWGHYGLARELAAIYNRELKGVEGEGRLEIKESKDKNSKLKVSIKDYDLCPRYLGLVVEGVKVKESPLWLKNILSSIGLRPINNIVDITNYVMAELGQPMHAFDQKKVDSIVVRRANPGEKIITLDKVERKLEEEMLVIADSKKPIAIAGVMGGENSQITGETQKIILESANFNPISIRKTAQRIGLRTDASMRFEKSLDPVLAETALRRAAQLIKEIIPEAECSEAISEDSRVEEKNKELEVEADTIRRRIGENLKTEEMVDILKRLGFETKDKKDKLTITVPSWRATGDVLITEDIVEEVARIYGYGQIKPDYPEIKMKSLTVESERAITNKIKDKLSLGLGMTEVLNYAFWPKKMVDDWAINKETELIELQNPMSEDQTYLRMSLVPGIMKNIADNSRWFEEFKIYELGRVFFDQKGKYKVDKHGKERLPEQPYILAGAVVTNKNGEPFSAIKGILEGLAEELGLNFVVWSAGKNHFLEMVNKTIDKEKRLVVAQGKDKIGWLGEINQTAVEYYGIKNRKMAIFEINLATILDEKKKETKKYQAPPKYPGVERDIAVEIAWKARWENIKQEIGQVSPLLEKIEYLSEYDLGKKKSLAFRLKYQAVDRTLKDEEINKLEEEILKRLGEKFGAKRR